MDKAFFNSLNFLPKENESGIYIKKYTGGYAIEVNFEKELIDYGDSILCINKTTQNFSQPENFVVLECVNRLLEKGYKPENIVLEKTWPSGHGTSGRLDVCVTRDDGNEYLLIECKTYGKEYDKAVAKMHKDGGQLFTYFKFGNKADIIMLYASQIQGNSFVYKNEIVKIEEEYRTGDVKDFYEKWNKLTKDNGVFDSWVKPYNFESKALTLKQLKAIKQTDSSFIFNRFLEILRHNVVSDKPNAFNKIFTLFLCKVFDEKSTKPHEELKFQWLEGKDDDISFQIRLTDLYKSGMKEFLEKEVTDFSVDDFDNEYKNLDEGIKQSLIRKINKLRLEKNNEFAIKEVYDEKSFNENAKIVKEVVELLQGYRLRYNKRQQYLSDFFEMLLTTGLKQESGQFFTPVPIAQFIIKSLPVDTLVNEKIEKGEHGNLLPYIMDYAAGSGHFLTEGMHEVQRLIDEKNPDDYLSGTAIKIKNWQADHFDWATQYVYGIEKDYRLVKVGKVGCYLHGDGLANVILSDGLANFKHTKEYKGLLKKTDADFPKENKQFDVVVSNPPYSVSAFKIPARNYYTGNDFELYDKLTDNSSEIECLFIERTKQLLKDGGVAGIILPSSILNNSGIYARAREIILQYFEIIGITELGSNTFMATGTNTVTLFLRRRNNYESINLKKAVDKFFTDYRDVTLNGIEQPVTRYVNHVWEGLGFDSYVSLLQQQPDETAEKHEIYKEYRNKLKAANEAAFWGMLLEREAEKLYYFIMAYPQQVVLIKSGQKNDEKRFLGYEFSNRRGSEGIHPVQRGKTISECTRLFDEDTFTNPEKASTYIYDAFKGDYSREIHPVLAKNISRVKLVDMLTFDRADFDKSISTAVKKKVSFESKWEVCKLDKIISVLESGKRPEGGVSEYEEGIPSLGGEHINLDGTVSNANMKYVPQTYFDNAKQGILNELDILICKDGALTGKVALFKKQNFPYEKGMINEHVFILRFDNFSTQKYMFNILFSKAGQELLKSNITGAAQGGLNRTSLLNIQIPVPPLEVQQKIVEEIEVLEQREQKIKEEIDENKKRVNLLIVNDNSSLATLKNILTDINPNKNNFIGDLFEDTEVSFLSMADISNNGYVTNIQTKMLKEVKKGYTFFQKDDILFAKITPCMENGKGALVGDLKNNIGFGSTEFFVLRSNKDLILPKLLYYFIQSDKFREEAEKEMTGASGHRRVPKSFIETYEIPLPPLSEQQQIVAEIEKIEEKIIALEKEAAAIPQAKEEVLKKYL